MDLADVVKEEDIDKWEHLRDLRISPLCNDVDLLIGLNAPAALEPMEVCHAPKKDDPFAVHTRLGWIFYGFAGENSMKVGVHRININKSRMLDQEIMKMCNQEFSDLLSTKRELSEEDKWWIKEVEANCKMVEGRYEIPLPFREPLLDLPNTKELAQRRIKVLRKKLLKEDDFRKSYYNFMDEMLSKNYAEEVPKDEWSKTENVWYIPHFGVRHSSKPEKVCVVFDCAAKVDNVSLNDLLVPGPDINNLLIDVLMRFREGKFGYSADIESICCTYQTRVDILWICWRKQYESRSSLNKC